MKHSFRNRIFTVVAALSLTIGSIRAQMPGMDVAMMKLFGDNKAFTTYADMSMTATNGAQLLGMPMIISMSSGQTRTEVDMEQAKGSMLPPEAITQMKMMNMTKIISVLKPDTKTMLMIYPGMTAYVVAPIPKEQVDALAKDPSIVKTKLGTETLDAHPCTKYKVIVTSTTGQKSEFTLWAATDQNEFPVKLVSTIPQGILTIHYKNTKLASPDAKTFEAPAGYTKYASQEEFQAAMMQKMMGGATAPK